MPLLAVGAKAAVLAMSAVLHLFPESLEPDLVPLYREIAAAAHCPRGAAPSPSGVPRPGPQHSKGPRGPAHGPRPQPAFGRALRWALSKMKHLVRWLFPQ